MTTADWARPRDLQDISRTVRRRIFRQDRLAVPEGVALGSYDKSTKLVMPHGNHALVLAGTRSGTTAGINIPAILSFPGSIIAVGVKDDLVSHTRAQRSQSGKIFIFDPANALGEGQCDVIDPQEFFTSENATLYIVIPCSEQGEWRSHVIDMMQIMLDWVRSQSTPLATPCLVLIDDTASAAPLPNLPRYLSTLGPWGISFITKWQGFDQIEAIYGKSESQTIINNSLAKMALPGISDSHSLDYLSEVTNGLMSPLQVRQQPFGSAMLLYGNFPPARMKLDLWFSSK